MSISAMNQALRRIAKLARRDGRYHVEAYLFVRQALDYAQFEMGIGVPRPFGVEEQASGERLGDAERDASDDTDDGETRQPTHVTGQQLCEAVRAYAADMFGLLARMVLNNWGLHSTSDIGEIVYNLIEIGEMSKSPDDRREDFDGVFDFADAFDRNFRITVPEEA